jgi:hypothetical protein
VYVSPLLNTLAGSGIKQATGSEGCVFFSPENKQAAKESKFITNMYLVKELFEL